MTKMRVMSSVSSLLIDLAQIKETKYSYTHTTTIWSWRLLRSPCMISGLEPERETRKIEAWTSFFLLSRLYYTTIQASLLTAQKHWRIRDACSTNRRVKREKSTLLSFASHVPEPDRISYRTPYQRDTEGRMLYTAFIAEIALYNGFKSFYTALRYDLTLISLLLVIKAYGAPAYMYSSVYTCRIHHGTNMLGFDRRNGRICVL